MTRKNRWIIFAAVVATLCIGIFLVWALLYTRAGAEKLINAALGSSGEKNAQTVAGLVPTFLGYDHPRTVLLLFLNNTELRPGGGFIGSYGVVTFDHGIPQQFVTNGTENLDYGAPATFNVPPPAPINDHLIARWLFRDSNWSPDFAESSRRALRFYAAEGGDRADKIETVIGVTPMVLETLLKYTGPLTASGTTYTADTITDALEYTVEQQYLKTGTPKSERKAVLGDLSRALVSGLAHIAPSKWYAMSQEIFGLLSRGQIIAYDVNADTQKTIEDLGWGGRMHDGAEDFLMQVDANLGSLKTDRVMQRALEYTLFRDAPSGEWHAKISATYTNTATKIDWRTTRYKTYTRWYLPLGTEFLGETTSTTALAAAREIHTWDISAENNRPVFGTFFVVEPGQTKTMSFIVRVAPNIAAAITAHTYGLYVQKQLGVPEIKLTVHHNFGKSYDWTGMIQQDKIFPETI